MQNQTTKKSVALIFVIILVTAGLLATYQQISQVVLAVRSSSWPETKGIITKSQPELFYVAKGKGHGRRVWRPCINYRYHLQEDEFTNDRIAIGSLGIPDGEESAQHFLKDYPVGNLVSVFYDPKSPSESALVPGARAATWSGLIFCFVFLLILTFILRAVLKYP